MNKKQLTLDKRYIRMAGIWAENSYCTRRKVGALIVKNQMIISDGYNGTPSGFENVCEDENNVTKTYVLHAEANAITKIARSSNSSSGATMYITASPCIECAKLIIQAGRLRRVGKICKLSRRGVRLFSILRADNRPLFKKRAKRKDISLLQIHLRRACRNGILIEII